MSWNIELKVEDGEPRVIRKSGELPEGTTLMLGGHNDAYAETLSLSMVDGLSTSATARKPKIQTDESGEEKG